MTQHLFPAHWGPTPRTGNFYHTVAGVEFGPSLKGESLADYKARVRDAYGNLRGVSFGQVGIYATV